MRETFCLSRGIFIGNVSKNQTALIWWGDLLKKDNALFLKDAYIRNNFLAYIVFRICKSKKVCHFFPFLRKFACVYYSLKYVKFSKNETYIVILSDHCTRKMDDEFLAKLKIKYNIKYVLVLLDPLAKVSDVKLQEKILAKNFDSVYSFGDEDCKNYGFNHFEKLYSAYDIKSLPVPRITHDLYFAGRNKGRADIIYSFLRHSAIDSFFRLSEFSKESRVESKSIAYANMIPYKKLIPEILSSNCLLELYQPGQSGLTWRYCEAVCYNKKLLTTNKDIENTRFYNPKYMHILDISNLDESIEKEIDWIKRVEPVNYNYDGYYSPLRLIEKIEKELEETNEF